MATASKSFAVGPVERMPAYVQVADLLRRAIQLDQFVPGDKLPSEPDLAKRLGVSRVTLREAIRQLEGEGLVTSRRPQGLFVARQEGLPAQRKAYLRDEFNRIRQLLDIRAAIEPMAARLAAEHRTKKDLKAMTASINEMRAADDVPSFRKSDSAFHLAIARASKNGYLPSAVEDARADMFLPFDTRDYTVTWSSSPADHSTILEAIRGRNSERAADAMLAHIRSSGEEIDVVIWGKRGRITSR